MAIYGIGGKPGGGKTYFCCDHLLRKYYEWDKVHSEYMRRFPLEIVTNIEELKLEHKSLDEMIDRSGKEGKNGTVETFFTVDYQRRLLGRFSRLVYIIDEAGKYFGVGFKDKDVLFFFQYHRHLGIDVYLVSAALEGVSRGILSLLEYRLIAKERSRRLVNEFRYFKYVGADKVGSVVLKPQRRIFALYKSMEQDEHEKIPAVTRRMAFLVLIFVGSGVFLFRYAMAHFGEGNAKRVGAVKASVSAKKISPVIEGVDSGKEGKTIKVGKGSHGDFGLDVVPKRVGEVVSLETIRKDYVKVYLSSAVDGSPVIYSGDGGLYAVEDVPVLLRDAVEVGGGLYVKRIFPPSRGGRRGGGEDRAKLPGDGVGNTVVLKDGK